MTKALNHDQIVDKIMAVLTAPGFPMVFSFDPDESASVRVAIGLTPEGEQGFAQPGDKVVGTVGAQTPFTLSVLHAALGLTPCGRVPKGLIREALEDLSRRERNRRAIVAANLEAFGISQESGEPGIKGHISVDKDGKAVFTPRT